MSRRIRISETELVNIINRVISEKRGSTTDREEKRNVITREKSCDYVEDCDFENTGMYWDPTECECVPMIV